MEQNKEIKDPIVWVDMEMSGLNYTTDKILEVAVIVTNGELTEQYEGPEIVVKCDKETLDNMNEWCIKHHGESGLTKKCLESEITIEQAEKQILDWLKGLNIKPKQAVLGGNSVYVDRIYLNKYMREWDHFLHYRIIDVSTIKELNKRWYPENQPLQKKLSHRALDDIKESIQELQHYRNTIFKQEK